jgi:hypothetical protein
MGVAGRCETWPAASDGCKQKAWSHETPPPPSPPALVAASSGQCSELRGAALTLPLATQQGRELLGESDGQVGDQHSSFRPPTPRMIQLKVIPP